MLEYAPLVWMGAAPTHLQRLDQVQHRALNVIGGNTVLQSLHFRRVVSGLMYLYKLQCIPGPPMLLNMVPPLAHPVTEPRTRRQSAERHILQLPNELPCASNDLLEVIVPIWHHPPLEQPTSQLASGKAEFEEPTGFQRKGKLPSLPRALGVGHDLEHMGDTNPIN